MKKTYKVQMEHKHGTYTAYEGKSRDKAADVVDTLKAALVYGRGTGDVYLYENGVADVVWCIKKNTAFLAVIGGASK